MSQNESSQLLGTEKLTRLMLRFSIPCVMSLLVGSLYNIVDQIFIGNSELSALGNAATGVVFPVFIIAQAFAWCFGDGCAAYLSICQGRQDTESAPKAIGAGITMTLVAGLAMIAILYPLKVPVLTLFGASENSLAYSIEYFNVIVAFIPVYMLAAMMNSVVRADGSPTWAMLSMLFGAIVNIILDPIFIFACDWGMTGAALATVIGQVVSFISTAAYFFRAKTFRLSLKHFIPAPVSIKKGFSLGASTFITQLTIVTVTVLCNVMLSKYGAESQYGADVPIAIIGIESKVYTVVINLVVGIALGCQPIISYNMGAKKYDRVKELYRRILLLTLVIGVAATLVFQLAPHAVVAMFGTPTNIPNPDDYWAFGAKTFRIFLSLIIFTCVVKMNTIFFQAAGSPIRAVLASMIRDIIGFIPLVVILPATMGVEGILYAAPLSDIIAMIVTVILSVSFLRSLSKSPNEDTSYEVLKPSRPGVIITVSREHGSGGKEIGRLVAQRLGIPFYYKETAALAAQQSGLDREFISGLEESSGGRLHTLYLSTDVIRQAVAAQDKVIKAIAENGSCVIVGRAADYVLRDSDNLVRIFIHAPTDYRAARISQLYGDSEDEARRQIRRSDEARASYYNAITGRKWGDRNGYELIIDSSIGIEASVDTVISYVSALSHK